jgi:hypothetical protein
MNYNPQELLQKATTFTFNALPEDVIAESSEFYHFNVTIEKRANNRWAVLHFNHCYNKQLEKEYESSPSNRTDEFKNNFRFSLEDAVEIAQEVSKIITIGRGTNAEAYTLWWRENNNK